MPSKELIAEILLISIALIWGSTFIMVKETLKALDAFSLIGFRFIISFAVLAGILLLKREKIQIGEVRNGAALGLLLLFAFATQTIGLQYISAAKSAFITGLFIVLVPLFMYFLGEPLKRRESAAAAIAFAGLAAITYQPGFHFGFGDMLALLCAVAFALHIVYLGKYVRTKNLIGLMAVQFGVVAFGALLLAGTSGGITYNSQSIFPILFLALFATLYAQFGQAWAQRNLNQVKTGIIFSLEPVSAGVFSFLVAGEIFTLQQLFGSALILVGILAISTGKKDTRPKPGRAE